MKDTEKSILWVDVGATLRMLREEKGETQSELGDAIGETRSLVNMWESGERPIKAEPLLALAGHFGCTVDYILGNSVARSPEPNMQTACAVTGLQQEAIENIKRLDGDALSALNSFLLNPRFILLLMRTAEYKAALANLESKLHSLRPCSPEEFYSARFTLLDMKDTIDVGKIRLGRILEDSLTEIYGTNTCETEIDKVKQELTQRLQDIIAAMPADDVEYSDDGQETS